MTEIKSLNKLAAVLKLPKDYLVDVSKRANGLYHPYKKLKKNGRDYRTIDNPVRELKQVQKRIEQFLLRPLTIALPEYMNGGIRGRSVSTNALPHVGKPCLLALDLSDCFGHINYKMVYNFYMRQFSCTPPVAKVLSKLTIIHNHLPQGGVTSPALCNLMLEPLMTNLADVVAGADSNLSNFMDDIFISGEKESLRKVLPVLLSIISSSSFAVNPAKLTLTKRSYPMSVAGVLVNDTTSIGRKRVRHIEREIMRLDPNLNLADEQTRHKLNSLNGEILYAYSVNPKQGKLLREKFLRHPDLRKVTFPV